MAWRAAAARSSHAGRRARHRLMTTIRDVYTPFMARTSLLLIAGLISAPTACGGTVVGSGGTGGSAGTSATAGTGAAPSCETSASSTLSGVSIAFPEQSCAFTLAQAAAGIAIDYQVVVNPSVQNVVPKPQDAGGCGTPGASGLIVFEELEGGGQKYCLCDVGPCPAPPGNAVNLNEGTYGRTFKWDGKNWDGPSDTVNPEGAPFPPGHYTLHVSAIGDWLVPDGGAPFKVEGTFEVELLP